MSIADQFRMEAEGISNTIYMYTTEHFIRSYAKQLQDLSVRDDKETIQEIISRLVEWYEDCFEDIMRSKFIYNKEEHTKSRNLLIEFQQRLSSDRNAV